MVEINTDMVPSWVFGHVQVFRDTKSNWHFVTKWTTMIQHDLGHLCERAFSFPKHGRTKHDLENDFLLSGASVTSLETLPNKPIAATSTSISFTKIFKVDDNIFVVTSFSQSMMLPIMRPLKRVPWCKILYSQWYHMTKNITALRISYQVMWIYWYIMLRGMFHCRHNSLEAAAS